MRLYVKQLSSYVDLDRGKKDFSMRLVDEEDSGEHIIRIDETTYAALTELLAPRDRPPTIPPVEQDGAYVFEAAQLEPSTVPITTPTTATDDSSDNSDDDDGVPSL